MALKITYKCKSCGYKADIYEGRGLFGQHITPVTCPDCHSIQNLVVGGVIGDVAPSFNTEVGRLCLKCGSDKIKIWDKKTCPVCGGEMIPTEDKEFWT
jgi:Zn finger protein HypA/HybF involved in hydrogenase expression